MEPSNQDFARVDEALPGGGIDARAEELLRRIREDAARGKLKPSPPPPPGVCPDCEDAGVVELPGGKADQCACVSRKIAARRLEEAQRSAGISKRHARCSFADFETYQQPRAAEALDAVQEWAESYARGAGPAHDEGEGLYVYGPPGTGKTHLAYAAVNALLMRPNSEALGVLVVTGPDLFVNLRRSYAPDPGAAAEGTAFLEAVKDAPLLVLDDLGAAKPSEWTTEQIHAITDHRLREMLPTLVTSNYDPEGIAERIGAAAASRLHEVCRPVPLFGPDRRRARRNTDGDVGLEGKY